MEKGEDNWPLVWFTALSPIAIGGFAGLLIVQRTPAMGVDWRASSLLGVALLALLASWLHLGRPFRAYRAIARLSTSWLSREVVLFGTFALLLAVYVMPAHTLGGIQRQTLVGIAAAAMGALSLWATGKVYRLPSRPAWDHGRTIASLFLGALGAGLLAGAVVAKLGGASAGAVPVGIGVVAGAALLTSAVMTCLRGRRPDPGGVEEFASWQAAVGGCRWILRLRILATLSALVFLLAPGWLWVVAWIPAAVGEIADRMLFFRSVVPVSIEGRAGAIPFEPVKAVATPAPRALGR
jgi:DMSO reductase anchor subunit